MNKQSLEERFWSKVDIKEPDECWPWLAGRDDEGYGKFQFEHRNTGANRISFYLKNKRFPNHFACHTCNNKWCCNPRHLVDQTCKKNLQDASRDGLYKDRKGIYNGHAKLTDAEVLLIFNDTSGKSQKVLGEMFNVSQMTVSLIKRRIYWKHVTNIFATGTK